MHRLPRHFPFLIITTLTLAAACLPDVLPRARCQSAPDVKRSQDPEKVDPNIVNVDFVVYQKKDGQIITNLKRNNCAVFLDGVQKEITSFSTPDRPVSAALLIEYSKVGSVLGDNRSLDLGTVAASVAEPAGVLLTHLINLPDDSASVVAYDMRPTPITDFTSDSKRINEAINLLLRNSPAFRESALFDAIDFVLIGGHGDAAVLDESKERKSDHRGLASVTGKRRAMILITSGVDTASKINLKQIRKTIQNAGVPIFVIGTGSMFKSQAGNRLSSYDKEQLKQAESQLNAIASETGGTFYPYNNKSDGPVIIQKISSMVHGLYSLNFSPDGIHDGKAHQIVVKVDVGGDGVFDEQTFVVQARQVYNAPKN